MGKIRVATLGDQQEEKEQKRRAGARRETKKAKKVKVEGLGLKGGQRVAVIEGTQIKPEFKKLIEEVESGESLSKIPKKPKIPKHLHSKRYLEVSKLVDKTKFYPLEEAIVLVKKTSTTKFDATVELHINVSRASLGEKPEYRGSVSLPHGTGKQVRVVIADEAVLQDVETGNINFDILVASPAMMPRLAKVARILGPKGLMPNPKTGTVGENPQRLAASLAKGQVNFKTEPDQPIIHLTVGKVSFPENDLAQNINAVLDAVGRGKITKATLSSTMGPGIKLALAETESSGVRLSV
ncbi:50S ribosomal protein L1 [Candidatus Gottesmanbacteria bacterium]|nr:50S ribosomal protein L1 [Candidatus Gottesmanbacteria bacterium]